MVCRSTACLNDQLQMAMKQASLFHYSGLQCKRNIAQILVDVIDLAIHTCDISWIVQESFGLEPNIPHSRSGRNCQAKTF